MDENEVATAVIGAAIEVHRHLGPGLLESAYELALTHELRLRGVPVLRQVTLPVTYKGVELDEAYRIDLVVCDLVLVEVKAVEALTMVHQAQLLTYLRLSGRRLGLLLNFHVDLMRNGVKRIALGLDPVKAEP